ncbi:MAG TPA: hypothetical protein IAC62_13615 [Candidatus Pelethocola excrementipullorum]|nr:hypothetical protein [Candidatus Pelethocola excrementipullorum]
MSEREMRETMAKCLSLSDESWMNYLLKQDLYYHRYDKNQCDAIVDDGEARGRRKAEFILGNSGFSGDNLKEFTEDLGVKVQLVSDEQFAAAKGIHFAQYCNKEIMVSKDMVKAIAKGLRMCEIDLDEQKVFNILLSHELYHYYEEEDSELELDSLKLKVQILPFLNRRISPSSAGEIAAFSFARTLMKLSFHPCLLEVAGLWKKKPELAHSMVRNICGVL